MRLDEFVRYCQTSDEQNPEYLRNSRFRQWWPELFALLRVPNDWRSWLEPLPVGMRRDWSWIFMGATSAGSPLHVDTMLSSAWNLVTAGSKRWTFHPPVEAVSMELLNADLLPFVNGGSFDTLECIQTPGDLVFTPPGWAHEVTNLSPAIAITENFVNANNWRAVAAIYDARGDGLGSVIRHLADAKLGGPQTAIRS